jgi:hypothetical protein
MNYPLAAITQPTTIPILQAVIAVIFTQLLTITTVAMMIVFGLSPPQGLVDAS